MAIKTSRAYSQLTIKSVDDDARIIRGIATTPTPDRYDDIVMPKGAKFTLPIPLLWQHDHGQPIGQVISATITDAGIEIEATVSKAAGKLGERLDEAWESIKIGLVRGLSIGFRAIKYSILSSGGLQFDEWDFYELSAVTIPANADASITQIKSVASDELKKAHRFAQKSVQFSKKSGENIMNYREILTRLSATIAEKKSAIDALQKTVSDEGRTKTADERETFDTLNDEIKAIELEIRDVEALEKASIASAKPIVGDEKTAPYSGGIVIKQSPEKLEPGIEFARFAACLGAARGDLSTASAIAQKRYPQNERVVEIIKAAVAAGTTTDAAWAGNLVDYQNISSDFVNYLRPLTIIGQFGVNGIPALRSIPFNVNIKGQSTASTAGWVGEGKMKPVTKGGYTDTNLGWAKIAAISVASDELLRFSNPSAERLIRDDLAEAVVFRMNKDFVDITKAAVANVSPASITNSLTNYGAGTASPEVDINVLWANADAGNFDPSSAVYVTTPAIARKLAMLMTVNDVRRFPDMTPRGGSISGVPVIVSNHVDTNSFLLVFASEIWLADDGIVTLDATREASLVMDSDPQGVASPTYVNMFQTNQIAFRAERYINWQKRRTNVVSGVLGTAWV